MSNIVIGTSPDVFLIFENSKKKTWKNNNLMGINIKEINWTKIILIDM